MAVSLTQLRAIALALPGVEERLCHGTPGFYVRNKLMARMQEDGEQLSLALPKAERDDLIERHPDVFSFTEHFAKYDYVLMNLAAANATLARQRIESAWRLKAARRVVATFDAHSE
ncbi:MmcQ/YjbR family DNA-binding protein [Oleiharenicola lentus]|uniref:MmcQ/YjbR family DNA-binding protein n=1 Tax=Oleiharenicola lentus TaxID=2508720 RepID=A0A4Q1C7U0_9BACT|nr:MmcQ/YjbR family DNA-binding protein [Oleiharenicola lentus]RXK54994.1 MmcQ/YjbR family DNA-binding protein [Oleiharenicola lentus]